MIKKITKGAVTVYTVNQKQLEIENQFLTVFGVSHPDINVYDVSEDRRTVEELVRELNKINFPPDKLYSYLKEFVDKQASIL